MIIERIMETYNRLGSIKATAKALSTTHGSVRKCLVSQGVIDTPLTQEIASLIDEGYTTKEISKMLNISPSWVNVNTPYIRGSYLEPSATVNAQRIRKCRRNKRLSKN